jgi:hypothetical protein
MNKRPATSPFTGRVKRIEQGSPEATNLPLASGKDIRMEQSSPVFTQAEMADVIAQKMQNSLDLDGRVSSEPHSSTSRRSLSTPTYAEMAKSRAEA